MNRKLKFEKILRYNHYDNLSGTIKKEYPTLWDDIFVKHFYYDELKVELLDMIDSDEGQREMIVLYGYSGTGKSTFLNWFKDQLDSKKHSFHVINLIEKAIGRINGRSLLKLCVLEKLIEVLTVDSFRYIRDHLYEFRRVIITDEEADIISDLADSFEGRTNKHYNLLDKEFGFTQILIIYLISIILKEINKADFDQDKVFVFCFDNMDELELSYFVKSMGEDILDVMSIMRGIIDSLDLGFYSDRLRFVLVMREANFTVLPAQLKDRLVPVLTERNFSYPLSAEEITKIRIDYFLNNSEEGNESRLAGILNDLLKDKKFVSNVIMPLFNYDYRRFMEASIAVFCKKGFADKLIWDDKKIFNYIAKEHIHLKRAVFLNGYLSYFVEKGILDKFNILPTEGYESAHCNRIRILITILSNLAVTYKKDGLTNYEIIQLPIKRAYESCKELFNPKDFFKVINALITPEESSYSHIFTLDGKEVIIENNRSRCDFTEEEKILNLYNYRGELTTKEEEHLSSVFLSLNPSGLFYLKNLFTHFEYYSVYKCNDFHRSPSIIKPLLCQLDIISYKHENNNCVNWGFKERIEKVFSVVFHLTNQTNKYYNQVFKNRLGISKDDFCRSDFVFRFSSLGIDQKESYPFFMSRVITTHIEYIENFRHFITSTIGFSIIENKLKAIESEYESGVLRTKKEINDFILSKINGYLRLLQTINDPTMGCVCRELNERLVIAERDPAEWVERRTNLQVI